EEPQFAIADFMSILFCRWPGDAVYTGPGIARENFACPVVNGSAQDIRAGGKFAEDFERCFVVAEIERTFGGRADEFGSGVHFFGRPAAKKRALINYHRRYGRQHSETAHQGNEKQKFAAN